MNTNIAIVIGLNAEDEPEGLYIGRDYEKALELLDNPPEGIHYVLFYRNLTPTRRRQTEESVLLDQRRQADAEKRSEQQRAALETKAKADRESKAADERARVAKVQAEAAAKEKSTHAIRLAEEAQTLERIAAEARAKCDQATAVTSVTATAPVTGADPVALAAAARSTGVAATTPGGSAGESTPIEAEATELAPGEVIEPEAVIATSPVNPEKERLTTAYTEARTAADKARQEAMAAPNDKKLGKKADRLEQYAIHALEVLTDFGPHEVADQ